MRTHVLRLASLLACVSLSGCDILPMGCDLVGEPIMVIEVRDAVTGQPAAEGATGRITEGDFTSSLRPTGPERMQPEAIERAGTYQVLIQKAGYQDWQRTVRVRDGGCHVRTERVEAELTPVAR